LRSGGELIGYYLSDDRRPAERAWSRRHADTQRDLCARYLEPVIGQLASQDIGVAVMQAAVNAAPTAKEGKRVRAMISALVGAGVSGGYLASDRLKGCTGRRGAVRCPRGGRQLRGRACCSWTPAEMPAADDVARLGQAVGANQWVYELMVNFAAYTGLRWGELIALTAGQISRAERVVTVDGRVVEVRGHLFVEAPKNRKRHRTIYPRTTQAGWPLAEMVAARIAEMTAEQASGRNPRLGGDGGVRSPGRRAVRTWES
jgi:hypothetical protein